MTTGPSNGPFSIANARPLVYCQFLQVFRSDSAAQIVWTEKA